MRIPATDLASELSFSAFSADPSPSALDSQRRNVDGGTEEKRSSCCFAGSFAASSCRCFRFPQQQQRLRARQRALNEHPMPRTSTPTTLSNCKCGNVRNPLPVDKDISKGRKSYLPLQSLRNRLSIPYRL